MTTFIEMLRDESGAAAAEYVLILAIVGTAIAASAVLLGNAIAGAMDRATSDINATNPATAA